MDFKIMWDILGLGLVLWLFYRWFLKPPRNFKDYMEKSVVYEMLFQNLKAINVLKKALGLKQFTDFEKSNIHLFIGFIYLKQKKYHAAVFYFDNACELSLKYNFLYSGQYKKIIKAYIFAGQKEKARTLYNNLLVRKSYDRRFEKLKKIEKWIQ